MHISELGIGFPFSLSPLKLCARTPDQQTFSRNGQRKEKFSPLDRPVQPSAFEALFVRPHSRRIQSGYFHLFRSPPLTKDFFPFSPGVAAVGRDILRSLLSFFPSRSIQTPWARPHFLSTHTQSESLQRESCVSTVRGESLL